MKKDSKGNSYTEVRNIRLTIVKSENRRPDKDWPGMDVIRIQAYRNLTSNSLHKGAISVSKKEDIIELIRKLLEIHKIL